MKIKFFLVLLLFSIKLFGQKGRQIIKGKIYYDSIFIDNIHIINKNTRYGTISNHQGIFIIPVKLNDTLQFTGIQFHNKILIIKNCHLNSKSIKVLLLQKTNELEEIEIKSNPFLGNLVTDINKVKIKSNIMDNVLDYSNIDFKPDILGDNGKIGRPPDASKLTNPHIPIGLTLIKVSLGKPFKKKEPQIKLSIREEFGDDFFIKELSIPLIHIDIFLDHCEVNGLTRLYKKNKKLEFTDAIIKESKKYLKKIKHKD